MCGRGKGSYNHPGNKQFRTFVQGYLPQYMAARTNADKFMLVSSIIESFEALVNPDTGSTALFVKPKKEGGWTTTTDAYARGKVGHALRYAIKEHEREGGGSKHSIKAKVSARRKGRSR